ncbi:hypothetical protein AMATHDRAFT_5245 [Amanita thiersii Skay4041]|uniref:Uncharacterized protein n=1 Tax=Amanita thiersii Skay4041 TaxID=703135 RepID=A0A2A9NEK4_9AGAR|nr:hypothetical protein AMATHDRAFT_5245 [Amanita thiersii Skay4041]
MSLNSPASSGSEVVPASTLKKGSSAWLTTKTNERAISQQAYASDPKYKKYTQQVEKCLNSFDNVHEWADCISFLKQLLKTFQSYMQFKEIPKKLIVAKRLAQCLNPALPTGVHQRALDVYAHILIVLGSEGLKRDLALWSSGLFPFFEYAATSVKPALLNLYDTHYLPLQAGLRPVMKAFIIALLPGLEEETGEFFEKVLGLLDRLSGTVSPSFFIQNIWLVMLTTPSARGTALNFLSRRLPAMHAEEDITTIVGRDIGLMIRAFSAALEDENLLVRRSSLDLLSQSIRVDSTAIRKAHSDDQVILMRAATGVVLRRDLSLNRRLYTWLLGPEEKSDLQIEYLKKNGLDLLSKTLKNEMYYPSGEYSETRPFKIFISLLDKWEIGAPLTQVLVYDAFKAIKQFAEQPSETAEDMMITASTLYEAVEPLFIWRQLLRALFEDITGDGKHDEAIRMVQFVLGSFSQDEEMITIHLPVIFSAMTDLIDLQMRQSSAMVHSKSTEECLTLLEQMQKLIPPSALLQRPEVLNQDVPVEELPQRPYLYACKYYDITPTFTTSADDTPFSTPFSTVFDNLTSIGVQCAEGLLQGTESVEFLRRIFSKTLSLMNSLVASLDSPLKVSWDPRSWLSFILGSFSAKSITFPVVDSAVTLVMALHQCHFLNPQLNIDDRATMSKMVNKLLYYLGPMSAVYHVRVVSLIWSLDDTTTKPHVESILAQSLTSLEPTKALEAYDAFGVLWRFSEDNLLPGFKMKIPMMLVLDALKSDDPSLRRVGETWMRCSLKSYLRILDPIVYELLDPSMRRTPTVSKVKDREIATYLYERPFDERYTSYLLELLLAIIRFGGQGFVKTARSAFIKRSYHPGLVQRTESGGIAGPDPSYLDVLVELLSRYISSEPKPALESTMHAFNVSIQSTSIDMLQAIVARGEIDPTTVEAIEAVIVGKLFFCIHTGRLDLQNKLLHLLHSIMSASVFAGKQKIEESNDLSTEKVNEAPGASYSPNSLLVQTLVDGLAIPTNRPILQHWMDFVLTAVPQFQPSLCAVVTPLNESLCRQLNSSLKNLLEASSRTRTSILDISVATTDAELITLLNGLERFILLGLATSPESSVLEEETASTEKPATEAGGGLLGYVSTVFVGSDASQPAAEEQLTSRSPGYQSLDDGIRVLYTVWGSLVWNAPKDYSSSDDSLAFIYSRTRLRCRRVLEHLFRMQSAEVLESIIDCWNRGASTSVISPDVPFELVDVLIASAQSAVHMICECIMYRVSPAERAKKQALNPNLSDATLFRFLEQYLQRLEGPLALQVWGRFLQLVKDITGGTREFKIQNYPALRCLIVLADKVTQTTAMEDRRIRKEVQDTFGRLLDSCVAFAGRSFDQGSWIRRSTKETLVANGRESPVLRGDSKTDEKADAKSIGPETPKPGQYELLVSQITQYLATSALPHVRKFLVDNDKVSTACSNIVYYVVNPGLKGKTRPLDVDGIVVLIIQEMARIPAAVKAWRNPVTDLLNDNRLFNSAPEEANKWKGIVKLMFEADKAAFTEVLARVAAAPSANIFTNREYEMLLRSINVRRLSFILFSGDKNQFLAQLPTILEKLVEILRNVTSPVVQSEVFLAIRVLLCRLSPHNLTSFWPVILTELYRIFEQAIISMPSDGSEDLQLVLAASKCLDLLIVLQTEEFQIHQWVFVTDTVDAVYRPDNWFPDAMMDQLAEIVGSLPVVQSVARVDQGQTTNLITYSDQQALRRPLLNTLRQIDSIRDLIPFFSNVSISSYESMYASGGNIDWEAVEKGIMDDMFDGRS